MIYICACLYFRPNPLLQVDITKVPDFNKMYELYDPMTVMFFYRNKVRPNRAAFGV